MHLLLWRKILMLHKMQLRLNQYRTAKRVAAGATIFRTQIRDAMVVRRAVTLGLPVILVGQENQEQDNVVNDYRQATAELINHTIS